MMTFAKCVLAMLVTTSAVELVDVLPSSPSCSADKFGNADDTMMIQHRSAAQGHRVSTAQSASQMLQRVEEMAIKIVTGEEKITDATRLALITIDQEMDDIITHASQNHQDSQGTVDRAKQSIEACGTATTTSHSEAGGINDLAASVSTAQNDHNTCRTSEATLKQDDTTKCNDLSSYTGNLQAPSCSCSNAVLTKQCVLNSEAWFATAKSSWTSKEGLCNDATTLTTNKRTDCTTKQGTLESDFCSYASVLNSVCHTQDTCRSTEIALRTQTHDSVAVSETAFKAEYESAKHVKCILNVLNATDDATKQGMLSTCRAASIDSSHLTVTYHPIPSPATCDLTPVATMPGDNAWETTEYGGKDWNVAGKAPVNAVIACPTVPTTSAAPMHQAAPAPQAITTGWIKGANGATCDQTCTAHGSSCNSARQSALDTNAKVEYAFAAAGHTCSSFHGARGYAGTPFSKDTAHDDCAPMSPGATSVCNANGYGHHAALCCCVPSGQDPAAICRTEA